MSFVTQGPVPPNSSLFAGREQELKTIDSWCRNLDCYAAVMGARQTGKTSFLLKFKENCRERYAFVSVNLQGIDRPDLERVCRHIAEEIQQQVPGIGMDTSLPASGTSFLSFLRQVARQTSAARVVLLLDEYGALPADTAIRLAHTLRPVFNDRFFKEEFQRYFIVLAGATDMLRLTSGDNSPLANVTESIYLPDLTLAESEQVLQEGWGTPNPDLCWLIYEWTAGHPYWTQLLASRCALRNHKVDRDCLAGIVEELLQTEDRNLPHLLKGFRSGSELEAAAIAILGGTSKAFSRANPVIAELELLGAVTNHRGRCAVRNRLYEEVLRRHLVRRHSGHATNQTCATPAVDVGFPSGSSQHRLGILHLSDLHMGTEEDARNYATQLTTDLKQELGVDAIDYLIISGDVADHATPEQYSAACKLVKHIVNQFAVGLDKIIVAPGNHDVNWDLSLQAYHPVPRSKVPQPLGEQYIPAGPAGALVRDEEKYHRRFAYYLDFCAAIGRPYPAGCDKQGLLTLDEKNRILFLSLNSCWNLDHHFTERASIYPEALCDTLDQLLAGDYRDWLKIAVWHHPVSGKGCMADEFLQLLSANGFSIGMHGHIHEALEQFYRHDFRRGIHIIGAGTFGAPASQQVTGIPLQYNFLELDTSAGSLTVRSRKKEKRYGAWSADARWGEVNEPKAWYVIDVSGHWHPSAGPRAHLG
jgi:hypothetical protein